MSGLWNRRNVRRSGARDFALRGRRAWLALEALEGRIVLSTINEYVQPGGTLDIDPISSIFPSTSDTRMDVDATSAPWTKYGTFSLTEGAGQLYAWGTTPRTAGGTSSSRRRAPRTIRTESPPASDSNIRPSPTRRSAHRTRSLSTSPTASATRRPPTWSSIS